MRNLRLCFPEFYRKILEKNVCSTKNAIQFETTDPIVHEVCQDHGDQNPRPRDADRETQTRVRKDRGKVLS